MAQEEGRTGAQHNALSHTIGAGWRELATFLTHTARPEPTAEGRFVNYGVERGSTVLFPTIADLNNDGDKAHNHQLVYGAMGNPIQHELEKLLAELEGGTHTQVVGSGLAACTVPLLAFLNAGDHLLLPDSVYGPTRRFARRFLTRFGVETTFYPPMADEQTLQGLVTSKTAIIFAESPGSHTFEVQDIPMIARVAHEHGARLLLDNTWGIGAFKPFEHGVDVSIQALTKYPSGHSDVIIGAVTVAKEEDWLPLRHAAIEMGECASSDDCWLTLRGLRTMALRLERQAVSALEVAHWFKNRPEVVRVRHPAFPECPGHEFWKRDFTGASGLFGVELRSDITVEAMQRMMDRLTLFGIGASWGGYESLILPTTGGVTRNDTGGLPEGAAFRIHIGLENVADLTRDLEQAFHHLTV
ncbi:cystathionine beta-lyase [Saccharibacter floricola]|uniref:Cystathionine beta-lyase n=1 Tax=Saccharibacter floricola DSM 15669 TaxID=1123227 RepID=A0ABQ0P018_9PROT|nr:cystathionine beta-lyase [Saccharibacter floricola]GBQ07687.1 cystathionine beta-lyase [Saccharibacter floricola DSM 15669]